MLIHGSSYLYVGGITLAEDPRVEIMPDQASDGSRLLHLRITDVSINDCCHDLFGQSLGSEEGLYSW